MSPSPPPLPARPRPSRSAAASPKAPGRTGSPNAAATPARPIPSSLLAAALEKAKPGERILLVGFGQGCDALLFEATPALAARAPRGGVAAALARRREETNYQKFLAFNDLVPLERGMRAELDKATPLSAL